MRRIEIREHLKYTRPTNPGVSGGAIGMKSVSLRRSGRRAPIGVAAVAVLFLGETFYVYHAIGIAMIGAGVLLASIQTAPVPRPVLDTNRT